MNESDTFELEKINKAFSADGVRKLIRDPNHGSECLEAQKYLEALNPTNIELDDIGDRIGFDYFSMITDEGYVYFIPGLCRIALEERPGGISHLLLLLGRAHAIIKEEVHRDAILDFLDYVKCMNYLSCNRERGELMSITKQLLTQ